MSKDGQVHGCGDETDQEAENVTIIVDPFKIKLRVQADELGEKPPQNWKEVVGQVNRHLMRVVAGSTRLLSEIVEGTTRIVRGISKVPSALVRRIENAHVVADVAEEMKQEQVEKEKRFPSPEEASARINGILESYRAEGLAADIKFDDQGRPIIIVVRPEHSSIAEVIARKRLAEGGISERKRLEPGRE